jgi:hypothetical protein
MLRLLRSRRMGLVLAVAALAIVASSPSWALPNPWTTDLNSPNVPQYFSFDVTATAALQTSGTYAGLWKYEYEVRIDGDGGSGLVHECPSKFQVDVKGFTITGQGNDSSMITGAWVNAGKVGSYATWTLGLHDPAEYQTPGAVIGQFWFYADGPPGPVATVVSDSVIGPAVDRTLGPTPELSVLWLLLSATSPILGIGYLRRRKPE